MSDTALIVLDYGNRTAVFTERASAAKESALEVAGLIGRVSTPDENASAVAAQQELKTVLKLIEDTRQKCKEPVLDLGRAIDGAAKRFVESLNNELLRLGKLVGDYQTLEEAKRKAAEAARRLEEDRIQREKEAEERRVREEAEARQRKLDEEAAAARRAEQQAKTEQERAEAAARQHEIDRQKALAEAQSHQQMEAIQERTNQAAQMLPKVEAVRAEGQSVEEVWVIDQIREFELMKARPDLVRKVEFDLNSVKALLKAGVKLPGVTAHKETVSRVRMGRQKAAIEIA